MPFAVEFLGDVSSSGIEFLTCGQIKNMIYQDSGTGGRHKCQLSRRARATEYNKSHGRISHDIWLDLQESHWELA